MDFTFLRKNVLKNQIQTFFYSYNIVSFLFRQFSLVIKYDKPKKFHFSRASKNLNSPPLNLRPLESMILKQKDIWWYLGFFSDRKLLFQHHIHYYSNKTLSTIKYMKILGNLTKGLSPIYKHLLYRMYILSITLYGFQLWYFKKAPLYQPLKELRKMQRRVIFWIIRVFYTLPSWEVEMIAGFISIHFYLDKISI